MENENVRNVSQRKCTNDTIFDIDSYPLYRCKNTGNGGHTFTMQMSNTTDKIEIENQWVV